MKIDIEEFELMQRQYSELFREHLHELKVLLAEVREMNAMHRALRSMSEHEDELRRARAIAFAEAVQRDEDAKVN
jgi:hypothetical protein